MSALSRELHCASGKRQNWAGPRTLLPGGIALVCMASHILVF